MKKIKKTTPETKRRAELKELAELREFKAKTLAENAAKTAPSAASVVEVLLNVTPPKVFKLPTLLVGVKSMDVFRKNIAGWNKIVEDNDAYTTDWEPGNPNPPSMVVPFTSKVEATIVRAQVIYDAMEKAGLKPYLMLRCGEHDNRYVMTPEW